MQLASVVSSMMCQIKLDGRLSDEMIVSLHSIFHQLFEGALELIDKNLITHVVANPSGRAFYQIEGKKSEAYVCFGHYCSCPSHTFSVLIKSEAICCKHQLAVQLAEAMAGFSRAACKRRDVTDEEYVSMVLLVPPGGNV